MKNEENWIDTSVAFSDRRTFLGSNISFNMGSSENAASLSNMSSYFNVHTVHILFDLKSGKNVFKCFSDLTRLAVFNHENITANLKQNVND